MLSLLTDLREFVSRHQLAADAAEPEASGYVPTVSCLVRRDVLAPASTPHAGATALSREQVPHDFPAPHKDSLEQLMDYRVPVDLFSKLAEFGGSVMAERTKGELSARCGGTAMNFVAINLAHDIITGKRTVAQARQEYTRLSQAYQRGDRPPT
jgi:hypothetical protein